jgi:hypothetical protein
MLSNRLNRLLSAYVDNELTPRERKAVQRLLRESPEAHALLLQLQNNADAVRDLPQQRLGDDFSLRVLRRIAEKGIRPAGSFVASVRPPLPFWVGAATAATVLLAVGVGSYLYFAAERAGKARELADLAAGRAANKTAMAKAETPAGKPAEPEHADKSNLARAEPPSEEAPAVDLPLPSFSKDKKTQTPDTASSVLATAPAPREIFKEAPVKLAHSLQLNELDREEKREQLLKELCKGSAFRVDLNCPKSAVAMEGLKLAFKEQSVNLVIDQDARTLLTVPFPRLETNYALYAETLTPDETVAILRRLNGDRAKSVSGHRDAKPISRIVINSMSSEDSNDLCDLLGIQHGQLESAGVNRAGAGSGRKLTATSRSDAELVDGIKRESASAKPDANARPQAAAARSPTRMAVVLPYNREIRPKAASPEVKLFLDGRTDRPSGTMQLLIVLRENKK